MSYATLVAGMPVLRFDPLHSVAGLVELPRCLSTSSYSGHSHGKDTNQSHLSTAKGIPSHLRAPAALLLRGELATLSTKDLGLGSYLVGPRLLPVDSLKLRIHGSMSC